MTLDRAFLVALVVAGAVAGVAVAVGGAFYIPTSYAFLSLGNFIALAGVGPLSHYVGRAARSTAVGAVPAITWLVVTMVLATRRTEGDLIVTGEAFGLAFLLLGTVSAAVGIGTIRAGVERDVRPNGSSEDGNGR